jgi:D-alanine-D-alanine ligase
MLEPYIKGRELTIGVLNGKGMGVVEIVPKLGFYDYHNKYTPAASEYLYPAKISANVEKTIRKAAEIVFDKANCIDFARADFILDQDDQAWFLEMNTIPGMTALSLFPKSASCEGYSFEEVLRIIVESAIKRFIILEATQQQTLLPVFCDTWLKRNLLMAKH